MAIKNLFITEKTIVFLRSCITYATKSSIGQKQSLC